nr:synaptonemal complex central element protein 1-like isoform X1 [Gorilla gorilla gorilla]
MAGKLKPLNVEAPEAAEEAEGQAKSLKTEDLLAMVIKLQKERSLEPQIEDLISRINELQQAKKKSSEELRETHSLWEALHRELDSLNGEKVHLEEVLGKKQEALRILQMHCQEKESEAQRLDVKGQLEDLMGQHKDLWEFHMLEQRLAREIRALERSKEQLLSERRLVRAKLREVERRLRSPPEVEGAVAVNDGLKAELEIFGEQVQSAPEVGAGEGEPHPAPGRPDLSSPALATRRIRSRRWLPLTPSRPAGPVRSRPSLETRQEIKAMISDHARVLPGVCATRWSGAGRPGISRRGLCRSPPTSRAPGAVQRLSKCS